MNILRRAVWRTGATFAALAGILALSLTVPIPAAPDDGRDTVTRIVRERLPGWIVERVDPSWEGAYTVVTMCAGRQMGFQYVPGHGLGPDDAWLQPNDPYTRERLSDISDHWRFLVWYHDPAMIDTLYCREELAGERPSSIDPSVYD